MTIDGKGRGNSIADQMGGPDGYCVEPGHWRFAGGYEVERARNVKVGGWAVWGPDRSTGHLGVYQTLAAARNWIREQR